MKLKSRAVGDDYLDLIGISLCADSPARAESQTQAVRHGEFPGCAGGKRFAPRRSRLPGCTSGNLVSRYGITHYRFPTPHARRWTVAIAGVEQAGLSASASAACFLGNRGLGATLLSGRRQLSKAHPHSEFTFPFGGGVFSVRKSGKRSFCLMDNADHRHRTWLSPNCVAVIIIRWIFMPSPVTRNRYW